MRFPRKKFPVLPCVMAAAVVFLRVFAGVRLFLHTPEGSPETPAGGTLAGDGPASPEGGAEKPEENPLIVENEVVKPRETAGSILQPYLSMAEIQAISDACENVFSLRRLREGKPYAITTRKGEFVNFTYEIDNDEKLIVDRAEGAFTARLEKIPYDVKTVRVQGTITTHLFNAVAAMGETPMLAINMAEIFAWEINFIRDLRPGDTFTLLVEKRYREGEFKAYGRILAANFVNQGVTFEAFNFRDAMGFPHYYTSKGESVKRAFLKAPLSFTRISSTFSPKRLHPILKVWRAHPGIDYAAPTGTPVKAVGAGTVTFKGWGTGAGNYIAIRHPNNFETMYLHLSGFAKGLDKGKKVQQGEVIGFVGSTGYSTGPHLDFRMKKDGQYINPLKMVSPRTDPVSKKDFPEFEKLMGEMRKQLAPQQEKSAPAEAKGDPPAK